MLFPTGDNLQRFYERVPDEQMGQRLEQYDLLRRNHFSGWEAIKIITTLTIADKNGKRYLQALDLTTDAWQQTIKDRIAWYNKKMHLYLKKGLNRRQARYRMGKEVKTFYDTRTGDTRKDKTPWDSVREYYKIKSSSKTDIDFIDNLRKRDLIYRKKKMPFSATR